MDLAYELKSRFGDVELVKLSELVESITFVSKVRVRDESKRTDEPYEEISFNDVDAYGVIHPPKEFKQLEPANKKALISQRLHKGDLLIAYREGHYKVALFDGRYENKTLIGNSSMLRITFSNKRNMNTPLFVQAYLQLSIVQEYFAKVVADTKQSSATKSKKGLTSAHLLNLDIPYFKESDNPYSFKERFHITSEIYILISQIQEKIEDLFNGYDKVKEKMLYDELYSNSNSYFLEQKNDIQLQNLFKQMKNDLESCIEDFNIQPRK